MSTKTKKFQADKATKPQYKGTKGKKKPSSHDGFLQFVLEDPQVALAFFQAHLSLEISQRIDWSTFGITDTARREEGKPVSHTDITYHAKIRGTKGNMVAIYLHVEHQRNIDSKIVEQIGQYNTGLFLKHKKQGNCKWPIITTIVLYNGTKQVHPYHQDADQYFEDPELARLVMSIPYFLVNLNQMPEQVLLSHPSCGLIEVLLKQTSRANFASWLEDNRSLLRSHASVNDLKASLNYALEVANENADTIVEAFVSTYPEIKESIMLTIRPIEKEEKEEVCSKKS